MTDRECLRHELARNYVAGRGDFGAMPYHLEVEWRAALSPGRFNPTIEGALQPSRPMVGADA